MKANLKTLKKRRIYSEEFKLEIVKDFESGKFTVSQLEKLHGISNPTIYKWIYKYSTFNEKRSIIVEMKGSSSHKLKELQARVKELEGIVGRKQISIDYLEKMIEIAKDELDIDIKKLQHSTISWFKANKQTLNFSMNQLYKTIGISKQAVYQYAKRQAIFDSQIEQLVLEADDLRADHPGCGVGKMYDILMPDFIGRDRFIDTMMSLGYRIKKVKNYKRTTISGKKFYPNLIKGLEINAPNIVWQSDITYLPLNGKHYYAVFIIDVYTKKIVGFMVSDNMRAQANVEALKMALTQNRAPEIHNSDRGSQYTYHRYIDLLESNGTKVSMSLSGLDNAYAERINRTIKEEYLNYWKPETFFQLKKCVAKAVCNYNEKRTHKNLPKMSPNNFERYWSTLKPENRPLMTIFNNEINN